MLSGEEEYLLTKLMHVMGIIHITGSIISIIYYDFIGWFMIICIIFAHIHMTFVAEIYRGTTYSMSNWHWQTYIIWIIYAIYRLTNTEYEVKNDSFTYNGINDFYFSRITYNNCDNRYNILT